jgi:hypothetical protein
VSYEVKADPAVSDDLQELAAPQPSIDAAWRLHDDEIVPAIDLAIRLIQSLRADPYQGDLMEGRANAMILRGCRRLKFDPREPWPRTREGHPNARMRLVWINEPHEGAIALVRVLAVAHRFDARPYAAAATRLGALRRKRT